MNFDLSIDGKFEGLFAGFKQMQADLQQVNTVAKQTQQTIQVEARKSVTETNKLNLAIEGSGQVIGTLVNNVSNLGKADAGFAKQAEEAHKLDEAVLSVDASLLKLASSAIEEAQAFIQGTDKKSQALKAEVNSLLELQRLSTKAVDQNGVDRFTASIQLSTQKVQKLTQELKGVGDSKGPVTAGVKMQSFRTQIMNATKEAAFLQGQFNKGLISEATLNESIKKLAVLKEEFSDFNETVQAFNPEKRFQAFSQLALSAAGGFTALQGAMGLVGVEGDKVNAMLLKVQSALALSQGLNQLLGIGDAFKNIRSLLGLTAISAKAVAGGVEEAAHSSVEAAIATGAHSGEIVKLGAEAKKAVTVQKDLGVATKGATAAIAAETLAAQGQAAATVETTVATEGAVVATRSWTAALLANPIVAIVAALLALTAGIAAYIALQDDSIEEQLKFNEAQKQFLDFQKQLEESIQELSNTRKTALERELANSILEGASKEKVRELEKKIDLERLEAAHDRVEVNRNNINAILKDEAGFLKKIEDQKNLLVRLEVQKAEGAKAYFDQLTKTNIPIEQAIQLTRNFVELQTDAYKEAKGALENYNQTEIEVTKNVTERRRQRIEQFLNEEKATIQAQIILTKVGTQQRLQEEIKLIENERKIRLQSALQSPAEQALIEIETAKKISLARSQFLIRELEEQRKVDEARKILIVKDSEEDFQLRIASIKREAEIELQNVNLTAIERKAIILRANSQILLETINQKRAQAQLELTLDRSSLETRLAVVKLNTQEELQLKKDLIEQQADEEKLQASITITNKIALAAKIKEIDAKAGAAKLKLDKDFGELQITQDEQIQINRINSLERGKLSEVDFERQKQLEILNVQLLAKQKRLELIKEDGTKETELLKTNLEAQIRETKDAINKLKNQVPQFSLFKLLGLTERNPGDEAKFNEQLASILDSITQIYNSVLDGQIAAADQRKADNDKYIQELDARLQTTEQELTNEIELAKAGFASNVDAKRQEIAQIKAAKKAALDEDKRIQDEQRRLAKEKAQIDTAIQAASLLTAGAQIFAAESPKGLLGVIFAIAAVASMIAGFLALKNKVQSATSLEKGDQLPALTRSSGLIKTERTHGQLDRGHQIEGTNIFVRGKEFVVNPVSTTKHFNLVEAINKDDFRDLKFPDIRPLLEGTKVVMNKEAVREVYNNSLTIQKETTVHNYNLSTSAMENGIGGVREEVRGMRSDMANQETVTVDAAGTRTIKRGAITTTIK